MNNPHFLIRPEVYIFGIGTLHSSLDSSTLSDPATQTSRAVNRNPSGDLGKCAEPLPPRPRVSQSASPGRQSRAIERAKIEHEIALFRVDFGARPLGRFDPPR
jgi:hypothetical protein